MSLILEALRRSEAERRRASLPSLLGETAPLRSRRTAAWPIALGGMLLGLLIAGAAAWWWNGNSGTPRAPAPAVLVTPAAPLETPVEPVPAAAFALPPPAAEAPASVPRPRPAAAPVPPTAEPLSPGPATPLADIATLAPAAPEAEPTATADTGLGLRDGDLPWSTVSGEALPPLRVSMHVYADDPARRFAIVDGQRRREGDALPSGLTLLEIRRDGLRWSWQGRVLWMPR